MSQNNNNNEVEYYEGMCIHCLKRKQINNSNIVVCDECISHYKDGIFLLECDDGSVSMLGLTGLMAVVGKESFIVAMGEAIDDVDNVRNVYLLEHSEWKHLGLPEGSKKL